MVRVECGACAMVDPPRSPSIGYVLPDCTTSTEVMCAHTRCFNIGPFGGRFYKGRGEFVPYKLCLDCRNRNAEAYQKNRSKVLLQRKTPESRTRERELRKNPIQKQRALNTRRLWVSTPEGRAVVRRLELKRQASINESVHLRLEAALAASIRGRLSGSRHGESANISNYTEFTSTESMLSHFCGQLKPGMTMQNYGTYWSIAHKIPRVYYDFTDPDEIRRCNSKANLGCDYEVWPNPLGERTNSSKGGMLPSIEDLQDVGVDAWPAVFEGKMSVEKHASIRKHRL